MIKHITFIAYSICIVITFSSTSDQQALDLGIWGLIGKGSDAGRDWAQEEKGTTEDEMAGWAFSFSIYYSVMGADAMILECFNI